MKKYYVNLFLSLFFLNPLYAQHSNKYPPLKYIMQLSDIGKYYLYANSGFNADWYVGYNNCWIVKLPPVKKDGFERAYIGAKLGRAKLDKDFSPIEGKIYVAISDRPSFGGNLGYFLADSFEIPKESPENESVSGVDSAKWFWFLVPMNQINPEKDNYIAIWSPSDTFTSSKNAPIIAAGYGQSEEENVWLNRSIKGSAPVGANALEMSISGIKPAVAIKLVPKNEYRVIIKNFSAEISNEEVVATFSVVGVDIQKAWLELSYDKFEWQKISSFMYNPPYSITLKRSDLPDEMFYLRAAARDSYENNGYSSELIIPAVEKQSEVKPEVQNKSEENTSESK